MFEQSVMSRTSTESNARSITPRFLRLRDAPAYLGMDKNRFNREVRPTVTVIRIGTACVSPVSASRIDSSSSATNQVT